MKQLSILITVIFFFSCENENLLNPQENEPPTITNISSTVTGNSVEIRWEGKDPEGGSLTYFYGLDDSDPSIKTSETSHTFTDLPNGEHIFYLKARDSYGAYSEIKSRNFTVQFQPLTVILPNAQSIWALNEKNVSITWTWTGENPPGKVGIKFYKDDVEERPIILSTANDGSYILPIVPGDLIPSSRYQILVYKNEEIFDLSDYFPIEKEKKITVTLPNSSTVWEIGETNALIKYSAEGIIGPLEVYLYKGDTEIDPPINRSTPNTGNLEYTVPVDLIPGFDYRVLVKSDEAYDYSEYFQIKEKPIDPLNIKVTYPNNSTIKKAGEILNVEWDKGNQEGNVKIELWEGTTFVDNIVASTENDGAYEVYSLPEWLSQSQDYRVLVHQSDSNRDFSDSFIINAKGIILPNKPILTDPLFSSTVSSLTVIHRWEANGNPSGTKYEFYHGRLQNPGLVDDQITSTSYQVSNLVEGATYWWYVVAVDEDGYKTVSDLWHYTVNTNSSIISCIKITGPTSVNENTSTQYSCYKVFTNGIEIKIPNEDVNWSDNSTYTSLTPSGLLIAREVPSDKQITITAIWGNFNDTHNVTILDQTTPPTVTDIKITGPTSVNENTSTQYNCYKVLSNQAEELIPNNEVNWSENSSHASISSSGVLTTENVSSNKEVTLTANWNNHSDTHGVTILDQSVDPPSIDVTCPAWGDEFYPGDVVSIQWTSQNVEGNVSISLDRGNVGVETITSSTANDGQYSYTLPSYLEPGIYEIGVHKTNVVSGYSDEFTILDQPTELEYLELTGPDYVDENSSQQFRCYGNYSDGSRTEITDQVNWSENSSHASISSSGVLTAGDVSSDEDVTLTVSLSGHSDTHTVTIVDVTTDPEMTLLWQDSFEGTTLNGWTKFGNANHSSSGITTSVKRHMESSLQAFGSTSESSAALYYHETNIEDGFEIDLYMMNYSESLHGLANRYRGKVGLRQGTSPEYPGADFLTFDEDGNLSDFNGNSLGHFSNDSWHHVKITCTPSGTKTFDVTYELNGIEFATRTLDLSDVNFSNAYLEIGSGASYVWFDDLKFYGHE